MDVRIYDVEHGDAILIISDENEAVLVDCGWNRTTGWRPSEGLSRQGFGIRRRLHHLILTHPDQDHLADLPEILRRFDSPDRPLNICQHPDLDLLNLSQLKVTLSQAQAAYVARRQSKAELQPKETTARFRSMEVRQFYLPIGTVRDSNDLSLVTFIKEDGFTVCLPGDLNARGWRLHLKNPAFQYWLSKTNLFVAPHHGRPSGYCKELFAVPEGWKQPLLYPKLIVISNKEQIKGRQIVQRAPYRDHARGVKMPDGSFRKVLATHTDGPITVRVKAGSWTVSTGRTRATSIK